MVTGGKTSNGSIAEVVGCLLFLLAGEASKRQTVVTEGVVRPLAAEARGGGIPTPARAEADQVSGGVTIEITRGLLQPVAGEYNGGSATAALGFLLRSLTDKASSDSIPKMTGCVLLLSACECRNAQVLPLD